jgi:hypothetical protein
MSTPAKALTVVQVAAFIKRHFRDCRKDRREDLVHWVGWHMQRQLIVTIADEAGKLVGVALGRFLRNAEEGAQPWVTHEHGEIAWVDVVVAKRPEVMPMLVAETMRRWSHCRIVGGNIFKRAGELRMFPINRLKTFYLGEQQNGS